MARRDGEPSHEPNSQDGTGKRRAADRRGPEFGPQTNSTSETGWLIGYLTKSQNPANRTREKPIPGLSPQLLILHPLVDRPAPPLYTVARSARPVSSRSGLRDWVHD